MITVSLRYVISMRSDDSQCQRLSQCQLVKSYHYVPVSKRFWGVFLFATRVLISLCVMWHDFLEKHTCTDDHKEYYFHS